jgi:hypothetical protein
MSVKNFSPLLLDIFKHVSQKGEFTFECESEKKAHQLQYRLHALRREMRKEKHWLLPVAEACEISIRGNILTAKKPDLALEEALAKALREQGFKEKAV